MAEKQEMAEKQSAVYRISLFCDSIQPCKFIVSSNGII